LRSSSIGTLAVSWKSIPAARVNNVSTTRLGILQNIECI
jgi:hypothetical protein